MARDDGAWMDDCRQTLTSDTEAGDDRGATSEGEWAARDREDLDRWMKVERAAIEDRKTVTVAADLGAVVVDEADWSIVAAEAIESFGGVAITRKQQ
jgi:hypothetical protein